MSGIDLPGTKSAVPHAPPQRKAWSAPRVIISEMSRARGGSDSLSPNEVHDPTPATVVGSAPS
jgi:hypothetical protein